ncbi:hypothetical protein AB0K43_00595 [Kitasatospora sp. NPDC049258]|uniref:alpha/beta fold hydrolase n=1 Tax=Kitasatospora sp. NPDC049258 TaxID=3155394 RepID=UPI003429D26D
MRALPEATYARTVLGPGPGLAAGHTVVGVDYPGSGDTPRSTSPLSLDDLATLAICTIQDRFTSTRLYRQPADGIPDARLVELRTGHLPMVERPAEWQELSTDFLAQHNA